MVGNPAKVGLQALRPGLPTVETRFRPRFVDPSVGHLCTCTLAAPTVKSFGRVVRIPRSFTSRTPTRAGRIVRILLAHVLQQKVGTSSELVGCPLPTPSPGSVVPLKKFGKVRTCSELVCVPLPPRRMFGACNLWGAPSLAPPPGGGSPESVGRKTARSHPKLKSILECQRGSLIQFAFSGQPLSFCWPLGPRGGGE